MVRTPEIASHSLDWRNYTLLRASFALALPPSHAMQPGEQHQRVQIHRDNDGLSKVSWIVDLSLALCCYFCVTFPEK